MQSATFVMPQTSLPKPRFPAVKLLALYRLRWRIEIAFKPLKSLFELNRLLAKDDVLARTAICAKLIVALLTADLLAEVLESPPRPLRPRSMRSRWRRYAIILTTLRNAIRRAIPTITTGNRVAKIGAERTMDKRTAAWIASGP